MTQSNLDFSAFADANTQHEPTKESLTAFAAANHFTYTDKAPYESTDDAPFFLAGSYVQTGGTHNYFDYLSGQLAGMPFRMFTYNPFDYTNTTSGDAARIIAITLPYALPHIIVRAALADFHPSYLSPTQIAATQKIITNDELCTAYFDIFAPTPHKDEVASKLVTPDFIASLLQYTALFDVEIHGDKLYIYCDDVLSAASYKTAFTAAAGIIEALQPLFAAGNLRTTDTGKSNDLVLDRSKLGKQIGTLGLFTFFGAIIATYAVISVTQNGSITVLPVVLVLAWIAAVVVVAKKSKRSASVRPKDLQAIQQRFNTVNGA